MSIKQELREYYARTQPDLSDKHRRAAIQWDMKAVRRNRQKLYGIRSTRAIPNSIISAMVWKETAEGRQYWEDRYGIL